MSWRHIFIEYLYRSFPDNNTSSLLVAHWFWFVFNCRGIGFLGWNGRPSKKTSEQSSHTVPPQSMLVSLAVVKTKWQITVDLIKFQALSHWLQRKCCERCKVTQPKLILDIIFYIGHCWIIWSMYVVTLSLCWEPKPHFLGAWLCHQLHRKCCTVQWPNPSWLSSHIWDKLPRKQR